MLCGCVGELFFMPGFIGDDFLKHVKVPQFLLVVLDQQ